MGFADLFLENLDFLGNVLTAAAVGSGGGLATAFRNTSLSSRSDWLVHTFILIDIIPVPLSIRT